MNKMNVDSSDMKMFFSQISNVSGKAFEKELQIFLNGVGIEFLQIVCEQIVSRNIVDSRLLLNSFHKGHGGNIWSWVDGYKELEVGSELPYATAVNDGHWTAPKGTAGRFIPGEVELDANGRVIDFTYRRGAETGVYIKQQWIASRPYFTYSLKVISNMLPKLMEAKIDQIFERCF